MGSEINNEHVFLFNAIIISVDKEKRGDNKCVGDHKRMIQPITWLVLV